MKVDLKMLQIRKLPADNLRKIIDDSFGTYNKDDLYLLIGEDQTCMMEEYRNYVSAIENFEVRHDDIIVASFPKSGTTWTQEMVWLIKNRNNIEGSSVNICQRFPMLEACIFPFNYGETWFKNSIEYVHQIKPQRFIKTHLPFSLLPNDIKNHKKKPKIIYVVRNPKDVFVSLSHDLRNRGVFKGNLEDFAQLFLNDRVAFAPYWKHVNGFHNIRHLPNVLIIKYEDMKHDLKSVIGKVCQFLEEQPLTDEQLRVISQRLDFDFMKDNESVNHQFMMLTGRFMRAGSIGRYKQEMNTEMILKFDKWIEENISNTELNDTYWFGI